jgi:hypothetical protein
VAIAAAQVTAPGLAIAAGGAASAKAEEKVEAASKAKPKPGRGQQQISPLVEACVDHHTDAQELRMAGKLLESRTELRLCAAEACPALLQRDCVGWLEQVDKQIPSITFRITVDGQSHADVEVFVDGARSLEPANGRAVELNPGRHQLRVELPGVAAFEEEVVLSEGERYRMIEVSLSPPPAPAPSPPPEPEMHRPVPLMSYVLGGLAVAGAVSGGIWATSSVSLRRELEDSCAPGCPERRTDELRQRALITDISWGVSAVSLLGAATLFVFRPEVPVEVDVTWLPDGGGLGSVRVKAF